MASQRFAVFLFRTTSATRYTTSAARLSAFRPRLTCVGPMATSNLPRSHNNTRSLATMADPSPQHFMGTSGALNPVWIHTEPYSRRPHFPKLEKDLETDVCIVGSGISGISTAYELIKRGVNVVMIEARDAISGESGRTSGHLSNDLDDEYTQIAKKHGDKGAKLAADSHTWAIQRVGEIVKELGIDCEYRHLPGYDISQYPKGDPGHASDVEELKAEVAKAQELGLKAYFKEGYAIKGWDGKIDQRDAAVYEGQATFHPTKYLVGVLNWLKQQPGFSCYTHTRAMSIEEKSEGLLKMGPKKVHITTLDGHTITCQHALEATNIPLQKLSVVAQLEYLRTYCIAIRVPKDYIEDCLIYDQQDPYHYVRFTACDDKDAYLVIGGCDHKVGQEPVDGRFDELEQWVRDRFTRAGSVDYKWSGQIQEPVDYMAMIGLNQGNKNIYIITGDSGNGLTHGVLGGKLIADLMTGTENEWAELYSPKRVASMASSAGDMLAHDLEINAQYKRALQSDIRDIEDLVPGTGGVLNPKTEKPKAIYKDKDGNVSTFSAICPHLKGVVCWNQAESSWDCPVHGSRFGWNGVQIMGPAKGGLQPIDEPAKKAQAVAQNA